ncbi:MAG: hypothetical protein WAQ27_05030 [Candidatus Microsaccharimonas sp.]
MKAFIAVFALVIMAAFVFTPVATVAAAGALDSVCADNPGSSDICNDENKNATTDDLVSALVNTLLFIVGGLSVVMIIVGGILYATSAGNSSSVTKAKNTIIYSVIGVIVSFIAYAIVNWVIKLF